MLRKGDCSVENEQRVDTALTCLVIEVVAEEWCAAFCEYLVERTANAERKYSAILEV